MACDNLAYLLDEKVYINLTNKCTNDCVFCIRSLKDTVIDKNLWLSSENVAAKDVIEQVKLIADDKTSEIVFCGYGEPLLKLDVLIEVAQYLKQYYPKANLRINTNGQASLVYKKNVAELLKGLIDEVSVSLNGETEEIYNRISQPNIKNAYEGMKQFTKDCVSNGITATMSVVKGYKDYKIDIKECKKIAEGCGAKLRVREWLDNGY